MSTKENPTQPSVGFDPIDGDPSPDVRQAINDLIAGGHAPATLTEQLASDTNDQPEATGFVVVETRNLRAYSIANGRSTEDKKELEALALTLAKSGWKIDYIGLMMVAFYR